MLIELKELKKMRKLKNIKTMKNRSKSIYSKNILTENLN